MSFRSIVRDVREFWELVEEAEERKKAREAKKLAKESQAQKMKERVKQKKKEIESVKKWRKQRQQSGFAGDVNDAEFDLAFKDGKSFKRSNQKRRGVAPRDRSRERHDKAVERERKRKIGILEIPSLTLVRKGMKKQNTANSTDDLRGFIKGTATENKKRKR